MYDDITGIILAGGKSSRMGENKALLPLKGKTIIQSISDLISSIFENVMIITNQPDDYAFLNLKTFQDVYYGKGPLAGIHSGLINSKTEKNFIVSCDIPLVNNDIINFLVNYQTLRPITVLEADGFVQHLCGVYSKKLVPAAEEILIKIEKEIASGKKCKCKMMEFLTIADAEIIDSRNIPFYEDGMFLNVNKPTDYQILLEKIR